MVVFRSYENLSTRTCVNVERTVLDKCSHDRKVHLYEGASKFDRVTKYNPAIDSIGCLHGMDTLHLR